MEKNLENSELLIHVAKIESGWGNLTLTVTKFSNSNKICSAIFKNVVVRLNISYFSYQSKE